MSKNLVLHELTGSPNSVKARIALGYKGLDYERRPFDLDGFPGNRSTIAGLSRQPRLPVLQHGEAVVFDSSSILRYLEANFTETPRIFRDDYQEHAELEKWEMFARTQIGEPIGMIFEQAFSPSPDAGVVAKANSYLNERTGILEDRLSTNEFLVGDHLTVADITCAAPLYLADMTPDQADHPISQFFLQNLGLGESREKTRAWARRILSNDPVKGRR